MRLFLIAGEASGDKLGAALVSALRTRVPDLHVEGVGGPLMQAEGLESLFPMSDLSVMGLAEVLPRLRHLFRRRDQTVEAILAARPDAIVTIDAPDFNLRVARVVKDRAPDLPVIHYVAPSVWAWRQGRAKKMAAIVDHALALLPMEPPILQAAGVSCDFVGHPIAAEPRPPESAVAAFRESLPGEGPVLTVLPGSRTGEVTRLAPVFGVALGQLADLMPRVVVPVAGSVEAVVAEAVADWPVSITLLKRDVGEAASDFEERKRLAFAASDAALAASGTVALELAHAGAPMVVAYRMAPLTMAILRRMVRIGRYSLPNIIAGRDVVPELIQQDCTPGRIAAALRPLLSGGPEADGQRDAFDEIMRTLGRGGPSPAERAAESLLSVLRR